MIRAHPKPDDRYQTRSAGVLDAPRAGPIQNPESKIQNGSRAFTLIEMLVSLAVLALALTIVGVVFTTTTRAATQAAAYSETLNWVRQTMLQLEQDLKYVNPSESVLVIVGRTVPAALTQADLEAGKLSRVLLGSKANVPAGYSPEYAAGLDSNNVFQAQYSDLRADVLMVISNRPSVSQAPAPLPGSVNWNDANQLFQVAAAGGTKLSPVLIAYGHGALARAVSTGGAYQFPDDATLRHIEQLRTVAGRQLSIVPAIFWPLSRRVTILQPSNQPQPKCQFLPGGMDGNEWQRITRCDDDGNRAGDVAMLDVAPLLAGFGPDPATGKGPASFDPYARGLSDSWQQWDGYIPWNWSGNVSLARSLKSLLYFGGQETNHHIATVLEEVPVELRSNLGVQMLPGCAWFQVEFLMPEDPRNSVQYTPNPQVANLSSRADMPRWTSIEPGRTYVFVPDTQENRDLVARQVDSTGSTPGVRLVDFGRMDQVPETSAPLYTAVSSRSIRIWPYAVRITVRAYDPRGRLTEPIVRSIVHRFE